MQTHMPVHCACEVLSVGASSTLGWLRGMSAELWCHLMMAPCWVEYPGIRVRGRASTSSQHTEHSTTLCHTPAQTTCTHLPNIRQP